MFGLQLHRRNVLILGLLFLSFAGIGQDTGINLIVKLKHKGRPYNECLVKIYKDGSFFDQSETDQTARFAYIFEYDALYIIQFNGEGLASKSLELDLRNTPEHEKGTLHNWEVGEMSLFKAYEDMDLSILDKPVGRIHYDEDSYDFTIDYKYGSSIEKKMNTLSKHVAAKEKVEASIEKENSKEYSDLLAQGDVQFKFTKYDNALTYYQKAYKLMPGRTEAKQKIQTTNQKLESEALYKDLVLAGDELFRAEKWIESKRKYTMALELKENESYPKSQLSLLADKIKTQELENNQFNNFMAVADVALTNGKYEVARENYKKALSINPDAELAKRKLDKAQSEIRKTELAKENEQKRYASLIAEANTLASQNRYDEANQKIQSARKINPLGAEIRSTQNSVDQKKQIYQQELAKAEKQQAKQQQFDDFKKKAQIADQNGKKADALYYYNKALAINPNDQAIKSRVRSLNGQGSAGTATASSSNTTTNEMSELDKLDKRSDDFTALLASKYPQGKTTKSYKEGNKTITKVIVVKGNRGTEYMEVKHSWGGTYYFRNGDPIPANVWQKEAR